MRLTKYVNENARFIKADVEIESGKEYDLLVDHVENEELQGRDGGKTNKPVVYFRGKTKGFPLNKTNAKRLVELFGSEETDDWKGRKMRLRLEPDKSFGKEGMFIRVVPKEMMREEAQTHDMTEEFDDDDIPF